MKVLVVTNMWPSAADPVFGVFVREQVLAVRGLGIEVDVSVLDGRSSRANYWRAIAPLRRRLAGGGYDVAHAHYVLTGLVTWAALVGRRRPPLLATHHGVEVFTGWQAPLARWLTRRAARTLVMSRRMADRLGLGPDAVLPCGVDLEVFRPGPRAAARRALGLDDDAVLVAWVGVDRPEKRLALARRAVEALQGDVPAARLHVVTGVPHEEVARHLQAADVLLVTSAFEGGPLVVKEALACNRPVVSTAVGDVPELIEGLAGCALAEPEPAAVAAALKRALDVDSSEGRERVLGYASAAIAARLAAVYADVAARPASRPADRPGLLAHGR